MLLQRTIPNIGRHLDLSKRVSEHNYIIHLIRVPLGLAMAKVSSVEDYEKLQRLGQGSFGTVYKAKHKETSKIVANSCNLDPYIFGNNSINIIRFK